MSGWERFGKAWVPEFHLLPNPTMSTSEEAAQALPWKSVFRTSDSLINDPSLEAGIHADTRLSTAARGVLLAGLSYQVGWPIDGYAVAAAHPGAYEGLEELFKLGYLRVSQDYQATIGGGRTNVSLHGRTPFTELVASAQHFFFPAEELIEA
jgi:hypothetical protein